MERLLKKMEKPAGRIAWTAFDAWYIPWLFEGDDESDDDSDEDAATKEKSTSETTAATEGWGDISQQAQGLETQYMYDPKQRRQEEVRIMRDGSSRL
jgi:hypothetical protein